MDIQYLKTSLLLDKKVIDVLETIGCHHIVFHHGADDDYYTCANKDGDNPSAITVYLNSSLKCINYTRNMNPKKEDHDIIDLVCYTSKISFFNALNLLCESCGMDYYSMENEDDLPEAIKLVHMIEDMELHKDIDYDFDVKLQKKPEHILSYYDVCVNDLFKDDNISYATQLIFEVGYDQETNLITIPIRDELGNLVGVKGRHPEKKIKKNKYTYLIRCSRGMVLYNLFRSYDAIQQCGFVIVVESEKAVMQLYDMGVYNTVAISGSKLTRNQLMKLISLQADVVLAMDKDVPLDKVQAMADRFPYGCNVYALIDTENILKEKESPSDSAKNWNILFSEKVKLH